ncbi:hypothetical protein [Bacillus smithii]|uniref:hypothetical protein n=1 Tax=Bacillus smithii TaxID=1479 RepID=UPI0030C95EDC
MKNEFKDQLKEWKRQQRLFNHLGRKRQQKRKSEHFSRREIEDLMGMNRPVYERRRGAIRRKY